MTNIKQIGLALVSVCLTSLLAQSIFAVDYKLQLDYETIDQEYLTEKTSDSTSAESYLGLVFENRRRTRKASLYLYPNRQIADFLVKWKQSPTLESSFYLHYDSASEDSNKTKASGQVNIGRRNTFSLKLAKGHALNTFRRGGNNLILEATKQEIHVVKNNTANTIELGYASGGFNFAIIVENGANADSAFGGESYELDGFRDIAQSLSQEFRSSIDPSIVSELEFYEDTRDQASEDASIFLNLFIAYDATADQANTDSAQATSDAAPFVMNYIYFRTASDDSAENAITSYNTESYWNAETTKASTDAAMQLIFSKEFGNSSDSIEGDSNVISYRFYRTTADISLGQAGDKLFEQDAAASDRVRTQYLFSRSFGVVANYYQAINSLNDGFDDHNDNIEDQDYNDFRASLDTIPINELFESWLTITGQTFESIASGNLQNNADAPILSSVTITSDAFLLFSRHLLEFEKIYNNLNDASVHLHAEFTEPIQSQTHSNIIGEDLLIAGRYLGLAYEGATGLVGLKTLIAAQDVQDLYNSYVVLDTSADFYYDIVASDIMLSASYQASADEFFSRYTLSMNHYIASDNSADFYNMLGMGYDASAAAFSALAASNDASVDFYQALIEAYLLVYNANRASADAADVSGDLATALYNIADASATNALNNIIASNDAAILEKLMTSLEKDVQTSNAALKINWKNKNISAGLVYATGKQTTTNTKNSTTTTGLGIKYRLNNISLFLNSFNSAIKSEYNTVMDARNIHLSLEKARNNLDFGLDYKINKNVGISLALANGSISRLESASLTNSIQKETKNTHSIAELGIHTRLGKTAYLKLGYASTTETGKSSAGTHPTLDGNFQLANGEKATTQQIKLRYQQSF